MQEIWKLRTEYWYRKVSTYPEVINGAKAESKVFLNKLTNPSSVTLKEVGMVAIAGVQVYGAFCIGEIIGELGLLLWVAVLGLEQARRVQKARTGTQAGKSNST